MKTGSYRVYLFGIAVLIFLGGCTKKNFSVLSQMSEEQAYFFQNEMVPSFNRNYRADVTILNDNDSADPRELLHNKGEGAVGLIRVPSEKRQLFVDSGYLRSFESFTDTHRLKAIKEEFLLCTLGIVKQKQYYLPREFETRIMVYRKSKVQEALRSWRDFRSEINNDLRLVNGYGLPSNYILQENPELWDFYDIYVLGWIWSHKEYGGRTAPRIAHPVSTMQGIALRQIDHVYQFNADSVSVNRMQGDPVTDMFHWEALYAHGEIYNSAMWEQNWTKENVWEAFAGEEVFLSFLTQRDVFNINETDSKTNSLENDLGFATMPLACSVELDRFGLPMRMGSKSVVTGGWWWAVPANAPYPDISLSFFEYISGSVNQIEECSRFGMIPVRKEILSYLPIIAGDHWISELYKTSFLQMKENGYNFLPGDFDAQKLYNRYIAIWKKLVSQENWMDSGVPERSFIEREILGSHYTEE